MSLRTLVPDPGADKVAGVNLAEIPLGNPVTERADGPIETPADRDI